MATEAETKKGVKFRTSFCKHDKEDYSLNIGFDNCHTTMTTFNYDHGVGYHVELSIFDLSIDDMMTLANRIQEQAFIIRQSEQREVK